MYFIVPYILLFLSYASYSYLLGSYAYVNKGIMEIFQTSKAELGFINGAIGLGSVLGVIIFLMYSAAIKPKIVTYYTWNCIGYMLCYILILLSSIIWENPNKVFIYILITLIGFFRSIFMAGMMIIVKAHKEIYDQTHSMNEQNYKLLINIWSVGFDVGMLLSFFVCNWLQYSINFRWEYLVIIGLLFMLATTTMVFVGLRSYIQDKEQNQDNLLDGRELEQARPTHEVSFAGFFQLVNKDVPCKLFLINNSLFSPLHLGFCFILPVFFYDSGYKGNEGYLTAILNLFIIIGAWFIAILDFILHKIHQKINQFSQNVSQGEQKPIVSYVFTISLFFFTLTLIILTIISFNVQEIKPNSEIINQQNLVLQIILMCCIGFFFGGPLKIYNVYRSIKTSRILHQEVFLLRCYQRQLKKIQQQIDFENSSKLMFYIFKLSPKVNGKFRKFIFETHKRKQQFHDQRGKNESSCTVTKFRFVGQNKKPQNSDRNFITDVQQNFKLFSNIHCIDHCILSH